MGDTGHLTFKAFSLLRKKRPYIRKTRRNSALVRHRTAKYRSFDQSSKLIFWNWKEYSHYRAIVHESIRVPDYIVPVPIVCVLEGRRP
jgi:hypothetical protein